MRQWREAKRAKRAQRALTKPTEAGIARPEKPHVSLTTRQRNSFFRTLARKLGGRTTELRCTRHNSQYPYGTRCSLCQLEESERRGKILPDLDDSAHEMNPKGEELDCPPRSARDADFDLAYPPRGYSHLRKEPPLRSQVNAQVLAIIPSSIGGLLMFSVLWLVPSIWHAILVIAGGLFLLIGYMMWQAHFQINQRQEERHAQWELDGALPHEVAEEMRAYWLGQRLVSLGVRQEDMLEELTDETQCWMISFPQIDMHPETMKIDLALPAKVVDVKDVPLWCEVEKVKSPMNWIMLEEIALRDRQALHHRVADAPNR
jgi:hypothetical protein